MIPFYPEQETRTFWKPCRYTRTLTHKCLFILDTRPACPAPSARSSAFPLNLSFPPPRLSAYAAIPCGSCASSNRRLCPGCFGCRVVSLASSSYGASVCCCPFDTCLPHRLPTRCCAFTPSRMAQSRLTVSRCPKLRAGAGRTRLRRQR